MILWKFKEQPETRGNEPGNTIDWPCSAYRWVFDAGISLRDAHIGLYLQHKFKRTGEWRTSHVNLYEMTINTFCYLGSNHVWYDGPHCSFSLGPVHFNWFNPKCKKCWESS